MDTNQTDERSLSFHQIARIVVTQNILSNQTFGLPPPPSAHSTVTLSSLTTMSTTKLSQSTLFISQKKDSSQDKRICESKKSKKKNAQQQQHHTREKKDDHLHPLDVLVQSGETPDSYAGNLNLHHLVQLNIGLYEAAWSQTERVYIVESIVASIRHEGGRFLQFVAEWPRQTTSNEKPDDCVWILKEMTEKQAEGLIQAMLDDAIQSKQQSQPQEQHEQECLPLVRRGGPPTEEVNEEWTPTTTPIQKIPTHQSVYVPSVPSPRKPFRDLTTCTIDTRHDNSPYRPQKDSSLSLSSGHFPFDDHTNADDLMWFRNDSSTRYEFNFGVDEENNPKLANRQRHPSSSPSSTIMMPKRPTWNVSPICQKRKRPRDDDQGNYHGHIPSRSSPTCVPDLKRRCLRGQQLTG